MGAGIMALLVGGVALAGLLVYGLKSGQELPLWPAIAVALVNLVAAAKVFLDVRKARQHMQTPRSATDRNKAKTKSDRPRR